MSQGLTEDRIIIIYVSYIFFFLTSLPGSYFYFPEFIFLHVCSNHINLSKQVLLKKSEDADEMLQNAVFHQGLHCLIR